MRENTGWGLEGDEGRNCKVEFVNLCYGWFSLDEKEMRELQQWSWARYFTNCTNILVAYRWRVEVPS